jgi:hypothetical protein
MQVELREIPFAGAPDNFKLQILDCRLEIPQSTFRNPKLPWGQSQATPQMGVFEQPVRRKGVS